MEERRNTNVFDRKPWRYMFAVLIAGTGAILFVLGFIIANAVWLTWLGFAFIVAAIFYVAWFMRPAFPNFRDWWKQFYN